MGGGPSQQQKQAAASQQALEQQEASTAAQNSAIVKDAYDTIKPFATSRMTSGLPFYDALTDYTGGTTAAAFAPGRAAILRRFNTMSGLPSGMKEQTLADYDANEARAFDQGMVNNLLMNEQEKQTGAGLLTGQQQIMNPATYYGLAGSSNQSIMQAPLQSPGLGGLLGGIAGGVISKLPTF